MITACKHGVQCTPSMHASCPRCHMAFMLSDVRVQVENKYLPTYRTLGRMCAFPLDFVNSLFLTIHNRDFFDARGILRWTMMTARKTYLLLSISSVMDVSHTRYIESIKFYSPACIYEKIEILTLPIAYY